jgi:TolB-like protein
MLPKEELMKTLWPDSFVEESNLTQQISMIRKALGECPGEDRYIVTVSGRGYRFAAQVKTWSEARTALNIEKHPTAKSVAAASAQFESSGQCTQTETFNGRLNRISPLAMKSEVMAGSAITETALQIRKEAQQPLAPPATRSPRKRRRTGIAMTMLALLGITLGAVSYAIYQGYSSRRQPAEATRSLAILPFQNLNRDTSSDFLGFSLADAVITKLGYVSALTVRPSSAIQKYRDQVIDIPKVAAELNVDTLLTGNFIREGEDLRVTSQLIDVKTQNILWRESFDLKYDKLRTVQDNVAQQIIKGLELHLTPSEAQRMRADAPIDPLAYEYYLRGVDLYSRADFVMAIEMLEKSAQIDPNYALIWAHLGRAYNANASFQFGGQDHYRKAQAAFEKALSLQPEQIEARIYMANLLTDTGRVETAVPLLREALKANPNQAEVHWELGYAYRFAGMLEESAAECERARALDPGVKLTTSALNAYLYLGQYDKFLESLPRANDVAFIVFYRGFGEYYNNRREEAAKNFDRAYQLDPSLLQAQIGKAMSEGIRGQRSTGINLLGETEKKIEERGVGDPEAEYKIAQAYLVLGDKTSALRVFEHSVGNGFFPYSYLVSDPLLDGLRPEADFARSLEIARQRQASFRSSFF